MIKKILKKCILGHKSSSEAYITYLRSKGMKIGDRVTFYQPNHTTVDECYPWMIEIGNDVQITKGVIILSHGYDWSVVKKVYANMLGNSGPVIIKNNVFIGMDTIILPGVTIGNNVIIGAGSVVKKDIPDNCVAVGNPARVVMDLKTYYQRLQARQIEQASMLVRRYYNTYKKIPSKDILYEYFFLFTNHQTMQEGGDIPQKWKSQLELLDNSASCLEFMKEHKPAFSSYEQFIKHVFETLPPEER